ncbi:hypothetical protein [Prevotella histicola]
MVSVFNSNTKAGTHKGGKKRTTTNYQARTRQGKDSSKAATQPTTTDGKAIYSN